MTFDPSQVEKLKMFKTKSGSVGVVKHPEGDLVRASDFDKLLKLHLDIVKAVHAAGVPRSKRDLIPDISDSFESIFREIFGGMKK